MATRRSVTRARIPAGFATFAVVLGAWAAGCANATEYDMPPEAETAGSGIGSAGTGHVGGASSAGSSSAGSTNGIAGAASGGSSSAAGGPSGGSSSGGTSTTGGSSSAGSPSAGSSNAGSPSGGSASGGAPAGGSANGGSPAAGSTSSGGTTGGSCSPAYAQAQCLNLNVGSKVSSAGHNYTCADANCRNCQTYDTCAPGKAGCPWGGVWTDNGACN